MCTKHNHELEKNQEQATSVIKMENLAVLSFGSGAAIPQNHMILMKSKLI
jgi:hypothetical protein